MEPRQKSLREMRILHVAFVFAWFLFVFVLQVFLRPEVKPVGPMILGVIALAAVSSISVSWTLRNKNLAGAFAVLEQQPDHRGALARWRMANILSFTGAETAMLFGFVLRVQGASWAIAGWFFAGGLFLLLLWTPRLELPINAGTSVPPPAPIA